MTEPRRLHPADVVRTLADLLRANGLTGLYGSACTLFGVLSISYGLTGWTNSRTMWWYRDGNETT
jgi:hypothetical protein